VVVTTADGRLWEVVGRRARRGQAVVAAPVVVGGRPHLACRRSAVRVPPPVAAERRRTRQAEAQRAGARLPGARLALADGTVRVSTVPAARRTVAEALGRRRARWPIERVFKRWKDDGTVEDSRRAKPWRSLGAVDATRVAMVVPHWRRLTSGWTLPARSLRKAAAALREERPALRWAWGPPAALARVLARIGRLVAAAGGVGRRRRRPAAQQRWGDASVPWTGWADRADHPATGPTAPPQSLPEVA